MSRFRSGWRPRRPRSAAAMRRDWMPDARDGLCRVERIVLTELSRLEGERGAPVPTAMLYGRICDRVDLSPDELSELLAHMMG